MMTANNGARLYASERRFEAALRGIPSSGFLNHFDQQPTYFLRVCPAHLFHDHAHHGADRLKFSGFHIIDGIRSTGDGRSDGGFQSTGVPHDFPLGRKRFNLCH